MHNPEHHKYMNIALSLAQQAIGCVAPNPAVGCVLVKNNQIIATGITSPSGRPHAETVALSRAGENAYGATAYITLEPCCHTGKTPPCTQALIKAGIKQVIIPMLDPYKEVSGEGIRTLQQAGIKVVNGVLEGKARLINAGFIKVQEQGRPFITLKLATSSDGKIAHPDGNSKWITCEKSRQYAHLLRKQNDAIMVGINTVLADDPQLTCRLPGLAYTNPIRIVVDNQLRIPKGSMIVQSAKTIESWIFTTQNNNSKKRKYLQEHGLQIFQHNNSNIQTIINKCAQLGVTRLLVEGGSKLASSFIKSNLVDELIWIKAPQPIGKNGLPAIENFDIKTLTQSGSYKKTNTQYIEKDIVETYSTTTSEQNIV